MEDDEESYSQEKRKKKERKKNPVTGIPAVTPLLMNAYLAVSVSSIYILLSV